MKRTVLPRIMYTLGLVYLALGLYFLFWGIQIASFSVPKQPPLDAIGFARAEAFFCTFLALLGIGTLFILVPIVVRTSVGGSSQPPFPRQ